MGEYKILGFMTLYYGAEYLEASLLSVKEHVDKMVISYTGKPSHGINHNEPCPDTEIELYEIAYKALGDKLIWLPYREGFANESAHRDTRYKHSAGYDCILTIDSDEVMVGIPEAIRYAMSGTAQYYGIKGYVNFFRSFSWACYDLFRPIRIENLLYKNGKQDTECPLTVYHFSTALSEKYMRFKYKTFGHASEIKPNYLDEVFYKWSPENNFPDLHCVSIGLWNATPFDKNILPEYLKTHPNFNKHLI